MTEAWRREIVELHRFFQDWLGGRSEAGEEAFGRLASVLAEGFAIITPTGVTVGREALLDHLARAHGSHPGLEIVIRRPSLRLLEGALAVATYEEWHRMPVGEEGRLSTAILRRREGEGLPNGFEWVHVQETWLAAGSGTAD